LIFLIEVLRTRTEWGRENLSKMTLRAIGLPPGVTASEASARGRKPYGAQADKRSAEQ